MANYYDILGVSKNATQDEIKKAFRELSKKYHPDRPGGDEAKFKEINEAYETLSDTDKRRNYDNQGSFTGFNTGFSNGGFHFSNFRQMASDIRVPFTISLEDAHNGCSHSITVNGRNINIDIPKGTGNGKMLKIVGMGNRGINIYGQEAVGDLIVTVNVKNTDKVWLNDNGILEMVQGIDWIDAILGSTITINVLGNDVSIRVPKYTQNGGYIMVGGKGFHKFKSDECGNLKVDFIIRMPKSLTDEQISELKKVKESL